MSLARIFALALRLIRQMVRDKRSLALVFVVPLLIMSLLYLVLTGTSSPPTLALVRPTGTGSEQVNKLLDAMLPAQDKLHTISVHSDQVDSTLKDGDADAVLVFPDDFAQQVAQGGKPDVQLVLEGSDPARATVLRDTSNILLRQLGVALIASRAQSAGQGQQGQAQTQTALPSVSTFPFTIQEPRYLYGGSEYTYNDSLAPVFIGLFSFFFVFLLTSVAFLRERSSGTMERVLVSPVKRSELVVGYIFGFALFALIQALVILLFVVFVLKVHYSGNLALVFLVSILLTIGSVNLGIFLSTFARNEFQIVQFIPLVFGIQILLSGILWPIEQLPNALKPVAYALPLTYANDALRSVMLKGYGFMDIGVQLGALLVFALLMIVLSALSIRRDAV